MNGRVKNLSLRMRISAWKPLETFSDFYEEMHGRKMSLEEAEMMTQIFDDVKGEER